MKTNICIMVLGVAISAYAQTELPKHDWNVTLKAIDETGQPVGEAETRIYYMGTNEIVGLTDTNGIFTGSHQDDSDNLAFQSEKPGYYSFRIMYHIGHKYKVTKTNILQTIILKKIIKPIPMYAKAIRTHVPDIDKPIGYDLMVGDWVGPYGRGIQADFLFTAHFDKPTTDESDFTLTVSFPNRGDGIQDYISPTYYLGSQGSALRSNEEAPTNNYKLNWIQTDNRGPRHPIETNRDLNRNYYFRVRTKVYDNGNIVSAHYGKIYSDFMQFSYYLNPTPNDRNVEFDPKKNLMTNLKPNEGVSEP